MLCFLIVCNYAHVNDVLYLYFKRYAEGDNNRHRRTG